jgi:hypothetical protein
MEAFDEFSRMGIREGRELAKAQQSTNEGLAGPIAKARRERSIIHETLRRKRRKEEHQSRQRINELRRLTENCFHLEAIWTLSKLSRNSLAEEFGSI